jgi:hypothetical protein
LASAGSADALPIGQPDGGQPDGGQPDGGFQQTIVVTRDGELTSLIAAQAQLDALNGSLAKVEVAIKELMNEIASIEEKEKDEQGRIKDASDWQLAIESSLTRAADAYSSIGSLFGGPGCVLCFTTASSGGSSFDPASIPSDLSPLNGPLSLVGTLNLEPLQLQGFGTFSIACGSPECTTRVSYRRAASTAVPEPATLGLLAAALAAGLAFRLRRSTAR